jgi:hypothetical protein
VSEAFWTWPQYDSERISRSWARWLRRYEIRYVAVFDGWHEPAPRARFFWSPADMPFPKAGLGPPDLGAETGMCPILYRIDERTKVFPGRVFITEHSGDIIVRVEEANRTAGCVLSV